VHATLLADYVTGNARLGWPGGQIRSSVEGPGLIRIITGTDPALGSEIYETVPTGALWSVLMVSALLHTSATAGNRFPRIAIGDATGVVWRGEPNAGQAASLNYTYNAGTSTVRATAVSSSPPWMFPGRVLLSAEGIISTITAGLLADDNWDAPLYSVEEWIAP
jgi:hypothetical protein